MLLQVFLDGQVDLDLTNYTTGANTSADSLDTNANAQVPALYVLLLLSMRPGCAYLWWRDVLQASYVLNKLAAAACTVQPVQAHKLSM